MSVMNFEKIETIFRAMVQVENIFLLYVATRPSVAIVVMLSAVLTLGTWQAVKGNKGGS